MSATGDLDAALLLGALVFRVSLLSQVPVVPGVTLVMVVPGDFGVTGVPGATGVSGASLPACHW